jgi:excinuclease ABC subunit B
MKGRQVEEKMVAEQPADYDVGEVLRELEAEMTQASVNLEFEKAALLRDQIQELKKSTGIDKIEPKKKQKVKYAGGVAKRKAPGAGPSMRRRKRAGSG